MSQAEEAEFDVSMIPIGGMGEVLVYGVAVLVTRPAAGECFLLSPVCSHQYARLADGFLDDYELECPLHGGAFDIRTGAALCLPALEGITSLRVWVDNAGKAKAPAEELTLALRKIDPAFPQAPG